MTKQSLMGIHYGRIFCKYSSYFFSKGEKLENNLKTQNIKMLTLKEKMEIRKHALRQIMHWDYLYNEIIWESSFVSLKNIKNIKHSATEFKNSVKFPFCDKLLHSLIDYVKFEGEWVWFPEDCLTAKPSHGNLEISRGSK